MPYWVLFFMIVVGVPVIAGVAGDAFRRWARLKEKQMELAARTAGEEAARYAAQIERLEQRVRVLERIATDRGTAVAEEIERLRNAPLN